MDTGSFDRRLTAVSGVAFVVLWVLGIVTSGLDMLGDVPDIARTLSETSGQILFASFLGHLSAAALALFGSGVAARLWRDHEPQLAAIALMGTAIASLATAAGHASLGVAALRAEQDGQIADAHAAALVDQGIQLVLNPGPLGFALIAFAVGINVLRRKVRPAWLGRLTLLLAIALLIPPGGVAFFASLVFLLWVLLGSYLAWTGRRTEASPALS